MQPQQSTVQQHTPMFRPIIPAPPAGNLNRQHPSSTTNSPFNSPQANPAPQMGMTLPPFDTPPVSPFSNPLRGEYTGQNVFKLPPPIQTLSPLNNHSQQQTLLPPSPTHNVNQQGSTHSRYEPPIISKSPVGPQTSVFTLQHTQGVNGHAPPTGARTMQHHTSIIHPLNQHRSTIPSDKHLSTADQRELARKVSHSAIERRRRERINDKIMKLKELIPSCADQDHLHKLSILQSAIDYIQYLQELVAENRERSDTHYENGMEERRSVKRSKFDRYEIPSSSKHSRSSFETRETRDDNYRRKRGSLSSSASSASLVHHETEQQQQQQKEALSPSSLPTTKDSPIGTNSPASPHEDANVLLLLSTTNTDESSSSSQQKLATRNMETQTLPKIQYPESDISNNSNVSTSPPISANDEETDRNWDDEDDQEMMEDEKLKSGMSVQQLLCFD